MEKINMITAEISIYPIGTGETSISDFVANAEKVLKKYPHIEHKLNSMSTELCGQNLEDLFDIIKEMHLAVIESGALRVSTSIKIDDRRDKESTIDEKINSVMAKI